MADPVLNYFFGSKPKVPNLPRVDPTAEQLSTIEGNQASLAGAEDIAAGVNSFNLNQLSRALEFALPGGFEKVKSNIMAQLSGQLDPDVSAAIASSSVAKGFQLGAGGGRSGFGQNLVFKNLADSSQKTKQQGFQNFLTLGSAFGGVARADPSSMFLSPEKRVNLALEQNKNQFLRDSEEAGIDAAASPFGSWITGLVTSFAGGTAKQGGKLFANYLGS